MPINITDIQWQDIIVPFASAFAGAYFAYIFNVYSERKQSNETNFYLFNALLNQINVTWMTLLNYKIVYLSKVEQLIQENPQKAIQETIYPPNVMFPANVEQNIFLAKYNFQFLLLLSEIEKQTHLTQKTIEFCQEQFVNNNNKYLSCNELSEQEVYYGIETFELTKNYVDKSLSYLLLLREKLLKCKEIYFKFLYLDNRDILINHNFDSMIPDRMQFIEIVNFSENIENSWIKQQTLFDCIKLFRDKLCFNFSSFLKFIGIKK